MSTEQRIEVGLVLQGGGALGAYEWGAVTALLELLDELESAGRSVELKAVTGVSIGAINAACVVGSADRKDARRRMRALWEDLQYDLAGLLPRRFQPMASWWGLPGFFELRADWWNCLAGKYTYDPSQLLGTLADHVDFTALNASRTACVVTAVDVDTGKLTRFRNASAALAAGTARDARGSASAPAAGEAGHIDPRHILASGSLPPLLPWTGVGTDRVYWDGALVDNTPLGEAIDAFAPGGNVDRLLVVMNLFPLRAQRPTNRNQVEDRINELRYGNRLLQDRKSAERVNELAGLIDTLADLVPADRFTPALRNEVDEARLYKVVRLVSIDMQDPSTGSEPAAQDPLDGKDGHGDFSPATLRHRFDVGYGVARRILTRELLVREPSTGRSPSTWAADREVRTIGGSPDGAVTVPELDAQLSRN